MQLMSVPPCSFRSFLYFVWPEYQLAGAKQLRGAFMEWIIMKKYKNVLSFKNNTRFVQVCGWVFLVNVIPRKYC